MRAAAELCVELDSDGRSRLWLQSQAPLILRRTGVRTGRPCVHLLGGAGGPLGGDELSLRVRVGAGAALTVRSVAAMTAQPDADRRTSSTSVDIEVAEAGELDWAVEPLVVTHEAQHVQSTSLKAAAGAVVRWRETTVLGRHAEASGTVHQRLFVQCAGEEVLAQTQIFGPGAPRGWDGPAGTAGARVIGSLLGMGVTAEACRPTRASATLALREGVWLRTALGDDVRAVDRALAPAAARPMSA